MQQPVSATGRLAGEFGARPGDVVDGVAATGMHPDNLSFHSERRSARRSGTVPAAVRRANTVYAFAVFRFDAVLLTTRLAFLGSTTASGPGKTRQV
jgi:hypothetical protein